jgi:hypothetical protein
VGFSTIFWKIQGWLERRSILSWTVGLAGSEDFIAA